MPINPDNLKAVRLYRQGQSVRAIVNKLGCAKARVLNHLARAGIEPDPARESTHCGYLPVEYLASVEGISWESAKFLANNDPKTPAERIRYDREIAAAVARVKPLSMKHRARVGAIHA